MSETDLEIYMFPCLRDNYGFLIHDRRARVTAAIDTPDAGAIEKALKAKGWKLTHILNTHHHADHTGGNAELKARTKCTVVGPRREVNKIPGLDIPLADGDIFRFGSHMAQVIDVPGHTNGHIAYWFAEDRVAFVGDTLFAMGCGRLFEGTPQTMWRSLQKLMALPEDTVLYCAHEYTEANGAFALSVEPENRDLRDRMDEVRRLRAGGRPTVPTTLGLELRTNPFLRPMSRWIRGRLGLPDADPVEVFAELRQRKDSFVPPAA
ncbi:MAG: hydroxyacylglutathione hydrolase [Alphaproteobacteria bacterium]|nr:hydroxyacylglutathione hydrolase [Alphaproteobacteria bacterium]